MKEREASRRAQILKAVAECVAEEGIEGATLNLIAKRAGISAGLLAYYYKDKRELILEAARAGHQLLSERVSSRMGNSTHDWRRLQAWFEAWFPERDPNAVPWSFLLELWAHAARDPELQAYQSDGFAFGREQFAHHIETGIAHGELVDDVDPLVLADLFMALYFGLGVAVSTAGASVSPERASEIIATLVRLLGSVPAKESAPA